MQRASSKSKSGLSVKQASRDPRAARRAVMLASAAVAGSVALSAISGASGATITWAGTITDTNSGAYTTTIPGLVNATPLGLWDTTSANWTGDNTVFTVGDNVVFNDNFAGAQVIRILAAGFNPATMTFRDNGAGAAEYVLLRGGDYVNGATSISSNTAFGTNHQTVLTLDTGFTGRVQIPSRALAGAAGGTGNTIIRSGILEVNDALPTPNVNNANQPPVTLDGGEFRVNINRGGNTNPASGNLGGTLTVLSDSILSNGAVNASRVWTGPINVATTATLTLKSIQGFRLEMGNSNWNGSTGTIKLADVGANTTVVALQSANHDSLTAIFDLGSGVSEIQSTLGNTTFDFGALAGTGTGTFLSGSTASGVTTYSVGARGTDTTYSGTVRNGTSGTTAFTKVGTSTQGLAGANLYTGPTNVNAGTLALVGTSGSIQSSPITLNPGGTLRLDNSAGVNTDRLNDFVNLTANGGTLEFVGTAAGATESIPQLVLNSGTSHLRGIASAGTSTLTIGSLSRNNNATLNVEPAAGVNLDVTSAPAVTNGILPAWITSFSNGWATLSGSSIIALPGGSYTTAGNGANPNTWVAANNVDVTATSTLATSANINIHSLKLSGVGSGLSLGGGTTFNIGSGGIIAPGVGNQSIIGTGQITAGSGAAELFAHVPDAGNTLSITAPIVDNGSGPVTLVKVGPGSLLVGSGNTYTGGTQILGGGISVGGDNVVTGDLVIDNGTSFNLAGYNQNNIANVRLINGTIANTGSPGGSGAAATLTGTSYEVRSGTVNAILAGGAALTKLTGGTVNLNALNTYSGGTTIGTSSQGGGTLNVALSGGIGTGALNIENGTLSIGATDHTVASLSFGGPGGDNPTNGNITGTGIVTAGGGAITAHGGSVSGILAGSVGLNKTSTALTATLTGVNTYTGVTQISGGTASILSVSTLKNGGVASGIGQSSSSAANLVFDGNAAGGAVLNYTGAADSTDRLFSILNQSGVINSAGSGPIAFTNTGAVVVAGDGSGVTLTLGGGQNGANTFAPRLTGNMNFTKANGGVWELSNLTNNFTGQVNITSGILRTPLITNGGVQGPLGAAANTVDKIIFAGGTWQSNGAGGSTDRLFTLNANATLDSSGTGAFNFSNTGQIPIGGTPGNRTLTLTGTFNGTNSFAPQIQDTTAVTKTGTTTWVLTNANTYNQATTVSAGKLVMNQSQTTQSVITVSAGTLELASTATGTNVLRTTAASADANLAVSGTGKVDLKTNKLVTSRTLGTWNGSAYTGVAGLVDTGRGSAANAAWDGAFGIVTTDTRAVNNNDLLSIGTATAANVKGVANTATTTFAGLTVTGSDSIAMVTWGGDANLDGKINILDYGQIDFNVGSSGSVFGWYNGDFNYDGKINILDYGIIDFNVSAQSFTFSSGGTGGSGLEGVAAVPEPASLSVLALGAMGLMRRRRNRAADASN